MSCGMQCCSAVKLVLSERDKPVDGEGPPQRLSQFWCPLEAEVSQPCPKLRILALFGVIVAAPLCHSPNIFVTAQLPTFVHLLRQAVLNQQYKLLNEIQASIKTPHELLAGKMREALRVKEYMNTRTLVSVLAGMCEPHIV
jgi:hypothetical protein